MRDMFEVVSPFFGQLLSSTEERVVKVNGTTREQWLLLLSQLYPLVPRPELTPEQLGKVLPVAHKYNFPDLLQHVSTSLGGKLAASIPANQYWLDYIVQAMLLAQKYQLPGMLKELLQGISRLPWPAVKLGMVSTDFTDQLSKLPGRVVVDIIKTANVITAISQVVECPTCSTKAISKCSKCQTSYFPQGLYQTQATRDKPWFADL
ncbi:hypothetical protein V8C86DRAFT_2917121 [Haematococcus lacustris]